jgi:hypothetical protein
MAHITLRVLHGADRGRIFSQIPTPVTIGREEGNTIQLNDERISRYHLKLQDDKDKIVLTDLESTNGTKVNGEDIQVRIVRDGDMIAVGRSLLLVGSHSDIDRRIAEIAEKMPAAKEGHAKQLRERMERIATHKSDVTWARSARLCCPAGRHRCRSGWVPRRPPNWPNCSTTCKACSARPPKGR